MEKLKGNINTLFQISDIFLISNLLIKNKLFGYFISFYFGN